MRCLGIDYGAKRVGLSFGDELGVATPLPAIVEADERQRWKILVETIRRRQVTDLVIGWPLNMDDSVGPKAREVEAFAAKLKGEVNLPVHLIDERLTSDVAEASIPKARRRGLRASGIVDSRAATLILQDFLDQRIALPPAEE
ncbi:MAG: Holliday junction resolvase RuvX [Opitutaceae bacterium]|nr:Holliday junction resolvase RuvX [Opitutaceae bacterium]